MESSELSRNVRLEESTENHLRKETSKDITLTALHKVIVHGWPEDRSIISEPPSPYWSYRDELSVQNGIIYKRHASHGPSVYAQRDPQENPGQPFWCRIEHTYGPRSIVLARDEKVHTRHVWCMWHLCPIYGTTAPNETMRSLPIPTRPWQIVSQDICKLDNRNYLVTVCHFSEWIEADPLGDTLSFTVIDKTKGHFARYGVPGICHTSTVHKQAIPDVLCRIWFQAHHIVPFPP